MEARAVAQFLRLKSFCFLFVCAVGVVSGCALIKRAPVEESDLSALDLPELSDNKDLSADIPLTKRPEYLLGPEDIIEVLVWKDESLTRIVTVRPDGKISLPLIGEVQAAGLTPMEISGIVRHRLQKYYKEPPEVSVVVTEINSVTIFILGEVVTPGKQILRRETTLLQALSIAGGFKEFANTNRILLIRNRDGKEERMRIRYKDIIRGINPEGNFLLKAGDTIVVP
jgi:polysaccharide export outer membrane protein